MLAPLKFTGLLNLQSAVFMSVSLTMKRARILGPPAAIVVALGCVGKTSAFQLVPFHLSHWSILTDAQHAHVPPQWLAAAAAAAHPRGTAASSLNLFRNRRGSSAEKDKDVAAEDEVDSDVQGGESGIMSNDENANNDRRRRPPSKQGEQNKTPKKLSPRQLRRLANHPLHQAGQTFVAASVQSMGMLFYNVGGMEHKEIQQELLAAGTHLVSAAKSWDSDWKVARESLHDASNVFMDISDTFGSAQIDDAESLATLFESIGLELDDMSRIERRRKCADNLLAVRDHLASVAEILDENAVAESDDHDMITSFYAASDGFGKLAERYT